MTPVNRGAIVNYRRRLRGDSCPIGTTPHKAYWVEPEDVGVSPAGGF